jgi:hypothetical protein
VDHPEISFEVGAFGYEFLMKVYDTRHFPAVYADATPAPDTD